MGQKDVMTFAAGAMVIGTAASHGNRRAGPHRGSPPAEIMPGAIP
jgi:hypothetical protein